MPQTQPEILNSQTFPLPVAEVITKDLIAEGEDLFAQGQLPEAKALFLKATIECPGNAFAWNNLAVIALMEGDDVKAEKLLRQALEVQGDYLDAYHNLTEIYLRRGNLKKAAKELTRILEFKPSDLPTLKRLAGIYIDLEQPEKAQELLGRFKGSGAMKNFVDSLWLAIKFYAMADDLSSRDKLEKLMVAVLKYLDGYDGRSPRYKLVVTDPETEKDVVLEDFYDSFYYRESPSHTVSVGENHPSKNILVLTIGEHEDWEFFKQTLRKEMKAEGGCLGDFTQTRKVLRREPGLTKYDLTATLQYFRDNVGPCDCHVLRAALV